MPALATTRAPAAAAAAAASGPRPSRTGLAPSAAPPCSARPHGASIKLASRRTGGAHVCRAEPKSGGFFGMMQGFVEKLESEMGSTVNIAEPQTVQEAIDTGIRLYEDDRKTLAIDYFEKVFWMGPPEKEKATNSQLLVVWYNLACCHAYNGDMDGTLECVRQGVAAGLDFEAAVEAAKTEPLLCRLQCTTQTRQSMKRAAANAAEKRDKKK